MIDAWLVFGGVIAAGAGAGAYGLSMRDLVRRGLLHRHREELTRRGEALILPDGRVPCPECAEAILPAAHRCSSSRDSPNSLVNSTSAA